MEEILQETEVIESMPLIKKLAKIRKMSDAVAKEKSGYNYKYSDITTILAKVTTGQYLYHVSLVPEIVPGTFCIMPNEIVKTRMSKNGQPYDERKTEMLFTAQMNFKWVNEDNPEDTIVVPWFLTGSQEDPSQAFGSALTYCTRYFMTSYFEIAQPETDVDAYRTKQKQAEDEENKAVLSAIVERIDTSVKGFLAANADKREEVVAFIGKYVKGSNYAKITDPAVAAKLLNDFADAYLNMKEEKVEEENNGVC